MGDIQYRILNLIYRGCLRTANEAELIELMATRQSSPRGSLLLLRKLRETQDIPVGILEPGDFRAVR
jgi:hypothetical protein